MPRWPWLWIAIACFVLAGCNSHEPKKPDPTKGVVTGIVLCADTGKPARFASVNLTIAPQDDKNPKAGEPLPATESAVTDLDGRFRMEAVEPGHYYAYATLDGYLDPERALDFDRIEAMPEDDRLRAQLAVDQWKEHMVKVAVHVHRTADVTLQIERAAEICGAVSFDDGSAAIGMHLQVLRKSGRSGWANVGLALFRDWSLPTVSDSHGRFTVGSLPAGEYAVCAAMPVGNQDSAPRVCTGNVWRLRDASTVKVQAGEAYTGVEIVIPLSGLHRVGGFVAALATGHPIAKGRVSLLYADDREKVREAGMNAEGAFTFEYVPEGKYILKVSEAQEPAPEPGDAAQKPGAPATNPAPPLKYAGKEMPVTVLGDLEDLQMQLASAAAEEAPPQPSAPMSLLKDP